MDKFVRRLRSTAQCQRFVFEMVGRSCQSLDKIVAAELTQDLTSLVSVPHVASNESAVGLAHGGDTFAGGKVDDF